MTVSSRALSSLSDTRVSAGAARIGIDLVQVGAVERSVADFGGRFTRRLFAPAELLESTREGRLDPGALAARFAAKEAVIKAFDLSDAGIGWSQIEVVAGAGNGAEGRVRLHGRAAEAAARAGHYEIAVSLSQDGDLACAIVVALPTCAEGERGPSGAREGR